MAKQRGLGRGFDSLIPTEVTPDLPAAIKPAGEDVIRRVDPAAVAPNPHQPRTSFDADELASLAESIKRHGILHPPVVSEQDDGRYELIAGERRVRAAKLAGLAKIPVIVRSFDEQQKLELALLENVQRTELNPIETATAYRKLLDEFNLSLDEVADRMGKAKSTVANTVRLLALPTAAREAVAAGAISEAHGRAILAAADPTAQAALLDHITTEGWTVRQAEEFARSARATGNAPATTTAGGTPSTTA
ncbi:MAG TPA: ParB/RepB/Spo0J family partition protein, partial [Candidatus Saccharimonadales bacterium]|nr:ParB/RepB/Spo0J family partition protein [Candidatus Saccharimonadales bacterium]